jgi:hypothetical protein
MTIHHTRLEDVVVRAWSPLTPSFEVTTIPVQDAANVLADGTPCFARLNYDEALDVARAHDARLIAPSEVEQLRRVGLQLMPYLGTSTAENAIEHSERHDGDVWRQLRARGWDGSQPVAGAGKHWVDGAPAGQSRLMGWDVDGPGPGLKWWQPDAVAHNRKHFDDGSTTMLVRARRTIVEPAPGLASRLVAASRKTFAGFVSRLMMPLPPTLGEALLEEARKDLGVRESTGYNRGTEVDRYNTSCGARLGDPWCGTSLTTWLRRAALRLKMKPTIPGSPRAKDFMAQLQKLGRWFTADEIRANPRLLRPGMIHVWHRGKPGALTGHVGVHERVRDAEVFATVEGNSGTGPFGEGNRVAEMGRRFDDPLWLGAGWVD